MTTATENTFKIHTANWTAFEAKIAKINRKAAKIGVAPATVEVLERDVQEPIYKEHPVYGSVVVGYNIYNIVTITGEAPKYNGWTLGGVLNHVEIEGEKLTVVKGVPGIEVPKAFREAVSSNCDHCHTHRYRIDTYLVVNEAGEWKQVGSNCIADFLGGVDPKDVARRMGWLAEIKAAGEEFEGFGGGWTDWVSIRNFLGFVAGVIRRDGWTSRSKARDLGYIATADMAYNVLVAKGANADAQRDYYRATEEEHTEVEAALEWARGLREGEGELEDYLYNLSVACSLELTRPKFMGIVASVIPAYRRHMAREIERTRKSQNPSQYVGTLEKRMKFTGLTLARVANFETQYGVTTVYSFFDPTGNVLVWKSSRNAHLEQGKTYDVTGRVEKHAEYKGEKQTYLSRCKIEG